MLSFIHIWFDYLLHLYSNRRVEWAEIGTRQTHCSQANKKNVKNPNQNKNNRKSDKPKKTIETPRCPQKITHYTIPEDGIPSSSHLQKFLHNWKRLTKHRWPLSVISEGYHIQFQTKPVPWQSKKFNLSADNQMAIDSAVQ